MAGFIRGLVIILYFYVQLANILGRFQWMTCPRQDLSTGWLHCDPGPLFKPEYYLLPEWLPHWVLGHIFQFYSYPSFVLIGLLAVTSF